MARTLAHALQWRQPNFQGDRVMSKITTEIDIATLDTVSGGFVPGYWLANHPFAAAGFLANHPGREAEFVANHPFAGARVQRIQGRWGI
jgi:hypothetical protein